MVTKHPHKTMYIAVALIAVMGVFLFLNSAPDTDSGAEDFTGMTIEELHDQWDESDYEELEEDVEDEDWEDPEEDLEEE
tara:strand:+ start:53 stop:289 length:237 start_codon:yes stop_codon:yes gene_type:complete